MCIRELKRFLPIALLIFCITLIGCHDTNDHEHDPNHSEGHIHGHVEYNGKHIAAAEIFIWHNKITVSNPDSGFASTTKTDTSGQFLFHGLGTGDYYIYAKATIDSVTRKVGKGTAITTEGQTVELHLYLQ